MHILVLLTVSRVFLSDETLSQRFLQLCMLKMLLYVLVLLTVSGAFLVDEMLSWFSLQPVSVQDVAVYSGPAYSIWGTPVGRDSFPANPHQVPAQPHRQFRLLGEVSILACLGTSVYLNLTFVMFESQGADPLPPSSKH